MRTKYLLLVGLAALLGSCQNENEPKTSSVPGTEGDYRIIIEGDETDSPSRAGEKSFVGGTASGAGLYDGTEYAFVSATPNSDYEIDYFKGGPASDPDKYTTSSTAATTYKVDINGQDHTFHLKFKEKKRKVTINAGTGGRVNPSGTADYKVQKAHNITATPNSGYEFTGWSVSGSGITLGNSSNASTTFTLASNYSSNGTITARFKQKLWTLTASVRYSVSSPNVYLTASLSSGIDASITISGSFICCPIENGRPNYGNQRTEYFSITIPKNAGSASYTHYLSGSPAQIEMIEEPHITSVSPSSGTDSSGNQFIIVY